MSSVFVDRESLFLLWNAWLYYNYPDGQFPILADKEYDARLALLKGEIPWATEMVGFDVNYLVDELRRLQEKHVEFGVTRNCLKGGAYRMSETPVWVSTAEADELDTFLEGL